MRGTVHDKTYVGKQRLSSGCVISVGGLVLRVVVQQPADW